MTDSIEDKLDKDEMELMLDVQRVTDDEDSMVGSPQSGMHFADNSGSHDQGSESHDQDGVSHDREDSDTKLVKLAHDFGTQSHDQSVTGTTDKIADIVFTDVAEQVQQSKSEPDIATAGKLSCSKVRCDCMRVCDEPY